MHSQALQLSGRAARRRRCALAAAALLFASATCAAQGRRATGSKAAARPAHAQGAAARLVEQGVEALGRGDEAAARTSFLRALAADPRNSTAHTYLGLLADRAGDLKEAERHFAAAAAAAPRLPSALNNHGAILLRLGRVGQAAERFEASLRLDANQPSALVNLAQIRFAGGKPEDVRAARELFGRAKSLAPDAEIARALVVASLRLGEREPAAASYREYAALLKSGGGNSAPPTPSARAELGAALLESGLFDEAVEELSAAAQAEPSNVTALVALARAHLRRKEIPAAGRTLEGAVARGLEDARIYAALAEVYEAGGYVENAIPAMRLAIERDPQNEFYRFRYGMLLADTSAPAAAVVRLEEALREFPRSPRLWLALGIAQLANGKNDEAEKSFARASELDPKFAPALAYRGVAHAERGQYTEAVEFYERAIAAQSNLAVPFYLAADALLKLPDVDAPRVERYLTRAVELDPDFAPAWTALARLYERAGRWAEAASQLEHALQLNPQLAEARYQLGRVYMRLKRPADAKRELDTFKQLSEAQKEARDTRHRDLVRRLAEVRF